MLPKSPESEDRYRTQKRSSPDAPPVGRKRRYSFDALQKQISTAAQAKTITSLTACHALIKSEIAMHGTSDIQGFQELKLLVRSVQGLLCDSADPSLGIDLKAAIKLHREIHDTLEPLAFPDLRYEIAYNNFRLLCSNTEECFERDHSADFLIALEAIRCCHFDQVRDFAEIIAFSLNKHAIFIQRNGAPEKVVTHFAFLTLNIIHTLLDRFAEVWRCEHILHQWAKALDLLWFHGDPFRVGTIREKIRTSLAALAAASDDD